MSIHLRGVAIRQILSRETLRFPQKLLLTFWGLQIPKESGVLAQEEPTKCIAWEFVNSHSLFNRRRSLDSRWCLSQVRVHAHLQHISAQYREDSTKIRSVSWAAVTCWLELMPLMSCSILHPTSVRFHQQPESTVCKSKYSLPSAHSITIFVKAFLEEEVHQIYISK